MQGYPDDPKDYLHWEHWLFCQLAERGIKWKPMNADKWKEIKAAENVPETRNKKKKQDI